MTNDSEPEVHSRHILTSVVVAATSFSAAADAPIDKYAVQPYTQKQYPQFFAAWVPRA